MEDFEKNYLKFKNDLDKLGLAILYTFNETIIELILSYGLLIKKFSEIPNTLSNEELELKKILKIEITKLELYLPILAKTDTQMAGRYYKLSPHKSLERLERLKSLCIKFSEEIENFNNK